MTAGNHDPSTDTVVCSRCRRAMRVVMTKQITEPRGVRVRVCSNPTVKPSCDRIVAARAPKPEHSPAKTP